MFVTGKCPGVEQCSGRPMRVVLADDECLFRASLRQLLAAPASTIAEVYGVEVGAGFEVVGEAGSGEDTVRVVLSAQPDVLLLDLSMPRMSGLDALREITAAGSSTRTLVLAGAIERPHLLAAVHLGVRGLLLKNVTTELLFEAMMCVCAGQYWLEQTLVTDLLETVRPLIQASSAAGGHLSYGLTPRERQIVAMVVAGAANKEIARACTVSEQTVKHHLTRIFDKVGATSRVELAMLALRQGLVDPSHPVQWPGSEPARPAAAPGPALAAATIYPA
jgi:two-component system nitrate/nitrite response regulator NarL